MEIPGGTISVKRIKNLGLVGLAIGQLLACTSGGTKKYQGISENGMGGIELDISYGDKNPKQEISTNTSTNNKPHTERKGFYGTYKFLPCGGFLHLDEKLDTVLYEPPTGDPDCMKIGYGEDRRKTVPMKKINNTVK